MSTEDNKAIARNFLEGMWNKRDRSTADKLIASNHISKGPFTDQFPQGPQGIKEFAAAFLNAFPDVQATIDRQEAEGDIVRTWVTYRGTHQGQLMTIPPTGKRVTVPVLVIDRIAGGKIVESDAEWDPQDMLRQLGVA